jgi:equilibrative nucleoside transporter 1/2/3
MTQNNVLQAVFPPITTSIGPVSPSFHPLLFTSVHFLVFNLGDLIGRYLCLVPRLLLWNPSKLLTAAALRTLFIPLFLACNIQRSSDPASVTTLTTALISSDFLFFVILLAFGISNGYVCSMTMMAAPSVSHNPALHKRAVMYGPLEAERDVDVAATVASFFLVGGLAIGSAASFVVRGWVCGCNPFKG